MPSQHTLDLRGDSMVGKIPVGTVHSSANHQSARTPAPPPHTAIHERHIARFTDKFDRAKQYGRSPHIRKFGEVDPDQMNDKFGNLTLHALEHQSSLTPAGPSEHAAPAHHPVMAAASMPPELPRQAETQHEAMTRLPQAPPAPATPLPQTNGSWLRPALHAAAGSRVLTTAAAIAIMSGYIWLQNAPKMALQSANAKAGVNATLPSFVPSSYNLIRTDTGVGQVTLSFSSPSVPDPLTIAQQKTSWDSSSLLDNFVAKHTDAYSTEQSQGLTVYLFDNNKATWVNHGIWYTIDGATRLSREQILKIAYSL
jgi:hypothetical protein